MNAIEWLQNFPYLPDSREGKKVGRPSNSELRRWCKNGSVLINGKKVTPGDKMEWPIYQLVFFPQSTGKVTMW